ncbi:hypothetical protein K431DRAFT_289415 [Polychaeton citri CBS 116435]|uniref:ER lumen protein-retaining receptor n=1 Tax=Polychaeton citri CBS 116435 TaxID=1314669 RepID=A0A9P4UI33_9PEZI|nr:hypothetical protein K431DRAFT_289415 [Polychaeton citri CBS 116435]
MGNAYTICTGVTTGGREREQNASHVTVWSWQGQLFLLALSPQEQHSHVATTDHIRPHCMLNKRALTSRVSLLLNQAAFGPSRFGGGGLTPITTLEIDSFGPLTFCCLLQGEGRKHIAKMNIFRMLGDLSHLASILILLAKMKSSSSASGISFKSQFLYLIVYCTRYLDLFWTNPVSSLWNTIFKIAYIGSQFYIVYLMMVDFKPTHDPSQDTFKVQYLFGASALLALISTKHYGFSEVLWTFSIWLESVAIIPQLFMLQRTGQAETITTHYIFALGIYRALYIPNWIWRYYAEGHFELIPVLAGLIQTLLYTDFFYIYYTKIMQGKNFNLPV